MSHGEYLQARIKLERDLTNKIDIKRTLRQGWALLPISFDIYSNRIVSAALEDIDEGINVKGHQINNLLCVDDVILLAATSIG